MKRRRTKKTVDNSALAKEIVGCIDLPFKRYVGWKWLHHFTQIKKEDTRLRLEYYARQLLGKGLNRDEITWLFQDLAWDIYLECMANKTFEKTESDLICRGGMPKEEGGRKILNVMDLPAV